MCTNPKKINACIQVNISSEDSKSGCPDSLMDVAKLIESMKNINLKGIMALPNLPTTKVSKRKK